MTGSTAVRVAVDLMGGDRAPEAVVDGCLLAVDADPEVQVLLVGPADRAAELLAERRHGAGRVGDAITVVAAEQVVAMDEDPVRAVRSRRDATVRVAARLVRDGEAQAFVSAGSTGATLAASIFTLGRLPGVTRAPLAVVIPATAGPVVLLDAGAGVAADPDLLAQFALAGAAYARVHLGLPRPRVGLLTVGAETGKGDPTRKAAYDAIAAALDGLPAQFVGNVEGHDVPLGGRADVVVTDGFTGNVLLKGIEGTLVMVAAAVDATALAAEFAEATAALHPDRTGGALLLGIDGVVVVGHGSAAPPAIASCIALAARAVRADLVPQVATDLAELVSRRRSAAGLDPVGPR